MPRFSDFMDKFLPDWQNIKKEMNRSTVKIKE
jgi:hypothetical protein